MTDDFRGRLRRLQAKIETELDQDLALVRDEYLSLGREERKSFQQWVAGLSPLAEAHSVQIHAKAVVLLLVPVRDDVTRVLVSVDSLLRAAKAWDNGEDYVPNLRDVRA